MYMPPCKARWALTQKRLIKSIFQQPEPTKGSMNSERPKAEGFSFPSLEIASLLSDFSFSFLG